MMEVEQVTGQATPLTEGSFRPPVEIEDSPPSKQLSIGHFAYGSTGKGLQNLQLIFAKTTGADALDLFWAYLLSELGDISDATTTLSRFRMPFYRVLRDKWIGRDGYVPERNIGFIYELGRFGSGKDIDVSVSNVEENHLYTCFDEMSRRVWQKNTSISLTTNKYSPGGGTGPVAKFLTDIALMRSSQARNIGVAIDIVPIQCFADTTVSHTTRLNVALQVSEGWGNSDFVIMSDDTNLQYNPRSDPCIIDQKGLDEAVMMAIQSIFMSHRQDPTAPEISDVCSTWRKHAKTKLIVPLVLVRKTPMLKVPKLKRVLHMRPREVIDEIALEKEATKAFKTILRNPLDFAYADLDKETESRNILEGPMQLVFIGGSHWSRLDVIRSAWEKSGIPRDTGWSLFPWLYPAHYFTIVGLYNPTTPPRTFSRLYGYQYEGHESQTAETVIPKRVRKPWHEKALPHYEKLAKGMRIPLQEALHFREVAD